jgi:hypothetical protein
MADIQVASAIPLVELRTLRTAELSLLHPIRTLALPAALAIQLDDRVRMSERSAPGLLAGFSSRRDYGLPTTYLRRRRLLLDRPGHCPRHRLSAKVRV